MEVKCQQKNFQRMETMLGGFQSDLGAISSEIQTLQEQSVLMSQKLKNRQAVRGELSQFVDEMIVTDKMINTLVQASVQDPLYLEQVHELMHKIQFCQEQSFKDARSAAEVSGVLDKLKIESIAKMRAFLLSRIQQFKKPLTNYQVPQNVMLRFRFYNEFLMANERLVAQEVRDEYVETVSKMFYSYYKTYASRLGKLQLADQASPSDTIGSLDESGSGGGSGLMGGGRPRRRGATVFTLGDRGHLLLSGLEEDIIVPHVAQQAGKKYQLEALFRSLQYGLLENACREYLFLCDFFMVAGQSAADLFQHVMGKSLEVLLKSTHSLVSDSHDSIGLLLCIAIATRFQETAHRRQVLVALDAYWHAVLEETLWPRLMRTLFVHIESVRGADPAAPPSDNRPHYVVRRYAEFASAVNTVSRSASQDERLAQAMATLQREVEAFVTRLSSLLKPKKEQLVFLINNFDMLLGVLTENATSTESPEAAAFRDLQAGVTARYIDEVIYPYFGPLIRMVQECEVMIDAGQTDGLKKYNEQLPSIAKSFSQTWKKALEAINQEVMQSFTNFKNGTNILQCAFTTIVTHYHGFLKVLQQPAFQQVASRVETINIHHLMVEVKKYKPSF